VNVDTLHQRAVLARPALPCVRSAPCVRHAKSRRVDRSGNLQLPAWSPLQCSLPRCQPRGMRPGICTSELRSLDSPLRAKRAPCVSHALVGQSARDLQSGVWSLAHRASLRDVVLTGATRANDQHASVQHIPATCVHTACVCVRRQARTDDAAHASTGHPAELGELQP
jgi:hypothetical protein